MVDWKQVFGFMFIAFFLTLIIVSLVLLVTSCAGPGVRSSWLEQEQELYGCKSGFRFDPEKEYCVEKDKRNKN